MTLIDIFIENSLEAKSLIHCQLLKTTPRSNERKQVRLKIKKINADIQELQNLKLFQMRAKNECGIIRNILEKKE